MSTDDLQRYRQRRDLRRTTGAKRTGPLASLVTAKDAALGRLPVNRKRITLALDARGLDGPEVDAACGVEEPTVDKWETGELTPTPEQVAALAALTGMPVEFFYVNEDPQWSFTSAIICGTGGCHVIEPDDYAIPAYVQPIPGTDGRLW